MIAKTIAALVAALALPAAAQTATARTEAGPGKVPAAESKSRAGDHVTARGRARLAKAQNKELRCATHRQKKATAT
jgi:hypothetical protein